MPLLISKTPFIIQYSEQLSPYSVNLLVVMSRNRVSDDANHVEQDKTPSVSHQIKGVQFEESLYAIINGCWDKHIVSYIEDV